MKLTRTQLVHAVLVGILWFGICRVVSADQWGPPVTEHWSDNHCYLLHVAWPEGKKLTLFRATLQGGRETLWSRPFVDETWPPHAAYVTDDGQHVVLRDLYHNLGDGKVLVFLGPKGNVLHSYELADLLTQDQILRCRRTVSSTWWSEPGWFGLLNGDREFAFATHFGAIQCFDVTSGGRIAVDDKKRAELRARALCEILPRLNDKAPFERAGAARMCGALNATEAVPELKNLLGDRTVTAQMASGLFDLLFGGRGYSDVQVAAAEALAAILKTPAFPLIEQELGNATPATRQALLYVMASVDGGLFGVTETPDSPALLANWHRLSQSPSADVRSFAIKAVLARDKARWVYDRPELLKDPDQWIRYHAVRCLAERGDKQAIPLLRPALDDSDSTTQVWAFRGLVKYQPNDVLDVLHKGLKHEDRTIRLEAMMELGKRGDRDAIAILIARIAALEHHTHEKEGWGQVEREADEMCELVAGLKLSAAEGALRQAKTNGCEKIRRPVCGALAALGDRDSLEQLRQYARAGEALDRAGSTRMLALAGDAASMPLLRESLADREPWVRSAAQAAIASLRENAEKGRPTNGHKKQHDAP